MKIDAHQRYYLVTGASASQVERLTGLRAYDTHLGVLVERKGKPPAPAPLSPWRAEMMKGLRLKQPIINTVVMS